jgi:hypothetical protein
MAAIGEAVQDVHGGYGPAHGPTQDDNYRPYLPGIANRILQICALVELGGNRKRTK